MMHRHSIQRILILIRSPKRIIRNGLFSMVCFQVNHVVVFVSEFPRKVSLKEIQACNELKEMSLVKRGRLSVQTVVKREFDMIVEMANS
jgi:hypothetical protein